MCPGNFNSVSANIPKSFQESTNARATRRTNIMSDIYFKFQTHESNCNKGLTWLIYRDNMNSLERHSVEFSKFTDIPELFPTMDLMCP